MISLHDTEKVLGTYRKTWFVFLFTGVAAITLALAPFILFIILLISPIDVFANLPLSLFWFVTILWWWGIWSSTFIAFSNYYLDVFLVTDERILHINQLGPFSRKVAELRLVRIQDIAIEQYGIIPTLLHFGTIRVQTAGEAPSFSFNSVPRPTALKEIIMNAQRAALIRQHKHAGSMNEDT